MVTARTRLLALVTSASSFPQTGANATPNAATRVFSSRSGLNSIKFHLQSFN